ARALVKRMREGFEPPVPARLFAHLQAVDEYEQAAGFENACNLRRHLPAHIGRQLVIEEGRRDDVATRVVHWHLLPRRLDQLRAAQAVELPGCLVKIGPREI